MGFDEIKAMIHTFTREWPDAEWGPAHIVLSDFNLSDEHIKWCRGLIDEVLRTGVVDYGEDHGILKYDNPQDELMATDEFLMKLLEIPENERSDWVE